MTEEKFEEIAHIRAIGQKQSGGSLAKKAGIAVLAAATLSAANSVLRPVCGFNPIQGGARVTLETIDDSQLALFGLDEPLKGNKTILPSTLDHSHKVFGFHIRESEPSLEKISAALRLVGNGEVTEIGRKVQNQGRRQYQNTAFVSQEVFDAHANGKEKPTACLRPLL